MEEGSRMMCTPLMVDESLEPKFASRGLEDMFLGYIKVTLVGVTLLVTPPRTSFHIISKYFLWSDCSL
jgi:hypothetical protein